MLLLTKNDFLPLVLLDVTDPDSRPAVVAGVDTGRRLIELTIVGGGRGGQLLGSVLLSRMDGLHPEPDAVERWAVYAPGACFSTNEQALLAAQSDVMSMGANIRESVLRGDVITGGTLNGSWLPLSVYADMSRNLSASPRGTVMVAS